jgi:hypothetical protein
MLNIQTFDNRAGGNVLYKALTHPLAAEAIADLFARLAGPVAVYDPEGIAAPLLALHPEAPPFVGFYVHDVTAVGEERAGSVARALTELPRSGARIVLIAAFDAGRIAARIAHLLPPGAEVVSLDAVKLPDPLLSNRARYLDKLNFATNFAFFRDADGLSTRLVSANYWASYGGGAIRMWLRLFDAAGSVLQTWQQEVPAGPCGFSIDSRVVRERFGLPSFTGQLFLHAIGAAGHDVLKYALDTYASDSRASLSCTHDANAWPSDRYAGLPAPRDDEKVVLWLQNSHATPIPAGAVALDRMGAERPMALTHAVGSFATVAADGRMCCPNRAGRRRSRCGPTARGAARDEVTRGACASRMSTSSAAISRPIRRCAPAGAVGSAICCRLPRANASAASTADADGGVAKTLPLRLDVFDEAGTKQRALPGCRRDHAVALEVDDVAAGHAELVYDFRDGGEADGWLHALFRYEDRQSGHAAESSFGGHIFNTVMTYRDEPQSYGGPPPGLSTRLFLKLGDARRRSFAVLIYPASASWHARSSTVLLLHDGAGGVIAEQHVAIACSGSTTVWPHAVFGDAALRQAGPDGYVLVRDATCRLFGYHGLVSDQAFSFDHMFGF